MLPSSTPQSPPLRITTENGQGVECQCNSQDTLHARSGTRAVAWTRLANYHQRDCVAL